jgi:hypothetical protein
VRKPILGIVAGLLVLAAITYGLFEYRDEWNARVEHALEFAASETERADAAEAVADTAQARADSLASLAAVADTVLIDRIVRVRAEPVPDTCAPFVARRDSIIDEAVARGDRWRGAYFAKSKEATSLREALAAVRVANDTLVAVLNDRPIPLPAWVPEIRAGAFGGMCTTGPCAGVGVGVTWRIKIPI